MLAANWFATTENFDLGKCKTDGLLTAISENGTYLISVLDANLLGDKLLEHLDGGLGGRGDIRPVKRWELRKKWRSEKYNSNVTRHTGVKESLPLYHQIIDQKQVINSDHSTYRDGT